MSAVNDGGPAFPTHVGHVRMGDQQGMSPRDWFAGQALAGMLSDGNRSGSFAEYANDSYRFADAMLRAREAKQ